MEVRTFNQILYDLPSFGDVAVQLQRHYFIAKYLQRHFILLFSLWISALFFPALPPEVTTATYCPFDSSAMLVGLFYSHPMVYTLIYIFIDAVFFGVIATIALGISCYADNILFVFAGGMILYLIVDYIMLLVGGTKFSPLQFLKPTQFLCNAKPIIILAELMLLIILVAISFLRKERKKDVF